MKLLRCVFVAGVFGAVIIGPSQTASAGLDGPCQASAAWTNNGLRVDAETVGGDLVTIPRKDVVDWQGSVSGPPGKYSGSVWLELPPPFGQLEVDNWSGDSSSTSNSGTKDYNIPKYVPAGIEFEVAGKHVDQNGSCSGSVRLVIKGGIFDSPVALVLFALTLLFGAAFLMLILPMLKLVFGAMGGMAS